MPRMDPSRDSDKNHFSRSYRHMNRVFKLAASTLLLGLAAGGGGCEKDDHGGGAGGSSGGATSAGGSGSGGSSSVVSGGASGSGGQAGSDGAMDSGGGMSDGASGSDLSPMPDLPVNTDTPPFWPDAFAANCTPPTINDRVQADGHHHAGEDCMTSGCHLNPTLAAHWAGTDCRGSGCHDQGSPDGSGAPAFYFGGTIYQAVTLAADPSVEVGVLSTEGFYSACSAANGNFWYIAPSRTASPLTWSSASTRLRNTNGEASMTTTAAAGCNADLCHSGKQKLTSP